MDVSNPRHHQRHTCRIWMQSNRLHTSDQVEAHINEKRKREKVFFMNYNILQKRNQSQVWLELMPYLKSWPKIIYRAIFHWSSENPLLTCPCLILYKICSSGCASLLDTYITVNWPGVLAASSFSSTLINAVTVWGRACCWHYLNKSYGKQVCGRKMFVKLIEF